MWACGRVRFGIKERNKNQTYQADRTPGEEGSQTGQGQKPVEDNHAGGGKGNVGETTPGEEEDDGPERAARLVNVGEDLGSVTLLGERRQGTGSAVDARDTDGDDRDADDDVHERVVAREASVPDGNDERRGALGVGVGGNVEEIGVVGRDEQTDKRETQEVEEGDTPEDLLDSTGQRLGGVGRLSSGQTDKLGTGVGEGGRDEDGAETGETVLPWAGVAPGAVAPVFVVETVGRTTTADEDDGDDQEDDDSGKLEAGAPELLLSVTQSTEDVDDDDDDPEQ